MSEKPEALRLAEFYEALAEEPPKSPDNSNIRAAAFELRRLHADSERIGPLAERVLELKAQRDALLEEISALREVLLYSLDNQGRYRKKHQKIVDAAIKAVEGEKT